MTEQTNVPEPDGEPTDGPGADSPPTEDGLGTTLDRVAESIREARAAQASVAAHGDISTLDDQRAGEYSEDPGGEGGHP